MTVPLLAPQIREVRDDAALRLYGVALALTHALSMLFWRQTGAVSFLGKGADAICWPLVPDCETLRVLSTGQLAWALRGYFGISLVVAVLFVFRRSAGVAYAGLAALTLGKLVFLALDFRLRLNQHYMVLWISMVFLLLPEKRDALRLLLVLFYVWASTLKFNAEWLSGADLAGPLWLVPSAWTTAACLYVIVLELGVSWGLLAARGWIFWGALAQFVLFHAMSWSQVGFFFPTVMALLLSIFPLARLIPASPGATVPIRTPHRASSPLAALVHLHLPASTYALLIGFSLLQFLPALIPGDAALTGEGRPFALHMVDARVGCRGWAKVYHRDGSVSEVGLTGGTALRIACDPIVIVERARNICRHRSELTHDALELDLHLLSRRMAEPALRRVIDLPGFCARRIRYNPFWHNGWILIGSKSDAALTEQKRLNP